MGSPTINDIDSIIIEIFDHYIMFLKISDNIQASFRSNLWLMRNSYHSLAGSYGKQKLLNKWKTVLSPHGSSL